MAEALHAQLRRVGFYVHGEIKDAKDSITIFINQEDIDRGEVTNPLRCTAARCLQRAMGGGKVAMFLHAAYVQIAGEADVTRYKVSKELRDRVVLPQDEGRTPVPGTYSLYAPTNGNHLGDRRARAERLEVLRIAGIAPPVRRRTFDARKAKIRTRWAERI